MPVIHHLKPPLQAQGQSLGRSGKVHQRTWLRDAPGIGIEEIMKVGNGHGPFRSTRKKRAEPLTEASTLLAPPGAAEVARKTVGLSWNTF